MEHQRLYATALALEDKEGTRMLLMNADLHCGGLRLWQAAARGAGLHPSRVVLCGTHTHAGPTQRYGSLGYVVLASSSLRGMSASTRRLETAVASAAGDAIANLVPGGVAVCRGTVLDGGSNRSAPAWVHHDAGEIERFFSDGPGAPLADLPHRADRMRDPRVTALVAADEDGQLLGALAWYAIHGNSLGQTWERFGADLWGPARATAEKALNGAVVGFGGGSAGDISPRPLDEDGMPRDGEPGASRPDLTVAIGTRLGEATAEAVRGAETSEFTLAVAHESWSPTQTGAPGPRPGVNLTAGGVDGPGWFWDQARAGISSPLYEKRRRTAFPMSHPQGPKEPLTSAWLPFRAPLAWLWRLLASKQLPLHVLRVGDHAFATVPGEPTTMAGWRIEEAVRSNAGTASASVIGYAGDYLGYWVTPEEYLEQRYEAASTMFGRDAATLLTERLGKLANAVRAG